MEEYSCTELSDYLLDEGICQSVAEAFFDNNITGKAFLALTELEVKELAPKIGERVKLREILSKVSWLARNLAVVSHTNRSLISYLELWCIEIFCVYSYISMLCSKEIASACKTNLIHATYAIDWGGTRWPIPHRYTVSTLATHLPIPA